ncbi:chitobiase/beta-hexosaminidase C-terminal domain-containing protein [Bacillus sp. FJAT-52991]|uniref:Chitobiase/beta-hexosaminidase C-terminal domain-containing protein n=1 Tax=Bacillus kandeliae TaxID=3129297 RepID=A0ABZ2N2N7_9BACI
MSYKYRSGLRKGSSKNLMIGPGALFKNFDLANFDHNDITTFGELLGATKGGNEVEMELEYHTVEVDGALGAVQGMEWLTAANARIKTNLLEITKENLMLKLPNFEIATHNDEYDIIRHDGQIAPTVSNDLALVGEITGKSIPVIVVLENARTVDAFNLPMGDGKEDVVLSAEFESRYSEEEPTKIPFYILYPKGGSPVSEPVASPAPGTYTGAQSVTLTAVAGSKIYYTVDGSIPTPSTGTEYTGAISVSATTTIKAIAVVGSDTSAVAQFSYIINP